MQMSTPYKVVLFLSSMLLTACANDTKKTTTEALQSSASKKKPNVIIILSDDLGYGDISTYGQQNQNTPHIDKIAEEGVLCTDFYVPTPYCAPSRATLLTGRFPLRHGLV